MGRINVMPLFKIKIPDLIGFAAENAKPYSKVKVWAKIPLIISDDPSFQTFAEQISNNFFSRLDLDINTIHKSLVLMHEDGNADIYINDFLEIIMVKVNRNVRRREKVGKKDIHDIKKLRFPEININENDSIIYLCRKGWKFGLYFDFTKQINIGNLEDELGKLIDELIYQRILESTRNEIINNKKDLENTLIMEGVSDSLYLKKAKEKLHLNLSIKIDQSEEVKGDSYLIRLCSDLSLVEHSQKIIFMFDHDNDEILKKLKAKTEQGKNYQNWGNNVYSFIIPVPDNRKDKDYFSIEFYFNDNEIIRKDENGRRLYFSNEFNQTTGRHNRENLICKDFSRIKSKIISVVYNDVFDTKNRNIALSKTDFANNILSDKENFSDFDFSEFHKIFSIIEEIIKLN